MPQGEGLQVLQLADLHGHRREFVVTGRQLLQLKQAAYPKRQMRQLGNVAVRGIRGSAAELKGRSAYSRCGSQSQGRREHILDVRANHRGRTEVGKAVREYRTGS